LFDKLRRRSAAARLLEEQLYEQVVLELAKGQKRDGLWAKALANSDGLGEKAKALYVQYRVQSIKDEIEITGAVVEEAEKQARTAHVTERKKRIESCESILRSKGYRLKVRGAGWVVNEPLGGQQPIATLEELEQYARSRVKS